MERMGLNSIIDWLLPQAFFFYDWIGVHISLLVTYTVLFCTKGVRSHGEGSTQAAAQLSSIQ